MKENRNRRAKLNMITMLIRQLLTTLCGIVIPRVMIGAFGSVVYGATTSIAQFLSYISLLEGGIGRVARGALYEPLAQRNWEQVSKIHRSTRHLFRNVGLIFLVYTVILACVYQDIADITFFERNYTFGLVVAISLSTIANYFWGIGDMTLMHADQRQYITNTIITATNILNTVFVVLLVWLKTDVLTVKLVSSIVFIVRPLLYARYVKRNYSLPHVEKDDSILSQKWTGMGQHIAYFLHTNTDVVILTLFADLRAVAVYSVYHMIIYSIWNIASSFSGGMEAAFGEMIAKKEQKDLRQTYLYYKSIITMVSLVLFGCAAVLLIPFVKLYTANVSDADYVQPLFGLSLLLAEFMNCVALPCTTLPISANSLKQTRLGSYGEACLNIAISLLLIRWNPLLGVALGTLCATVFKCAYYMFYSSKNIIQSNSWSVMGRFIASIAVLLVIGVVGMYFMSMIQMNSFFVWCGWGMVTFVVVSVIAFVFCAFLFPQEMKRFRRTIYAKLRIR